jgi:hypothetical protein
MSVVTEQDVGAVVTCADGVVVVGEMEMVVAVVVL